MYHRRGLSYRDGESSRVTFCTTLAGLITLGRGGAFANLHRASFLFDLPGWEEEFVEEWNGGPAPKSRGHYHLWLARFYLMELEDTLWFPEPLRERWRALRRAMAERMAREQDEDGSWPNDVGPGRAFSTAVACRALQVW
ncbi:MAG: hypothetical protein H6833_13705 [Planctomycetes bacterium]|nr:hypothetical protein [Planctomycetota bacterium]